MTNHNDDIENLFSTLGLVDIKYQDMARDADAIAAGNRWPLVLSMSIAKESPPLACPDPILDTDPRPTAGLWVMSAAVRSTTAKSDNASMTAQNSLNNLFTRLGATAVAPQTNHIPRSFLNRLGRG